MEEVTVLIVDDNDSKGNNLTTLLQFEPDIKVISVASTGVDGIASYQEKKPDVVLMDTTLPDMDGFRATEEILAHDPIAQVIFPGIDDDLIEKAMDSGAAGVLTHPVDIDKLVAKIRKAAEKRRKLRTATAPLHPPQPEPIVRPQGKLISVYSARGGAGCTTLATNLALALHTAETPAVLVDAHLQYGDVTAFLNLQPRCALDDIAPKADSLDDEMMEQVLLLHESGLRVLPAPASPEGAELVKPEAMRQILTRVQGMCAYVVVDVVAHLDDVTVTVLEMSDLIVLVVAPDIPSIKNARLFLDTMEMLKLSGRPKLLVMNEVDRRTGIRMENVAKALRHPIALEIPFEREVVLASINRGQPLMRSRKTHPLTAILLELTSAVKETLLAPQAM